ncbi:MAG: patatin-like phospholipase family protein [Sphingobacteriales bacterium]|nr:MAG: patatin-like phospholipase family protein [Sphingobacteriales bacterium]
MQKILNGIYYSFPVQLLMLHIKRNKLLLSFWFLLFAIVTNSFLRQVGGAYLFLDPEYLGEVNFWGFFWVGLAFGFFLISWNIAAYMSNSFRFPFLGTLHSPFYHFCINNCIIPIAFIITYFISVARFQEAFEFKPLIATLEYFGGFLTGSLLMLLLFSVYFFLTNTNIDKILDAIQRIEKLELPLNKSQPLSRQTRRSSISSSYKKQTKAAKPNEWPVLYFINQRLSIRRVRLTEHYTRQSLLAVFQQNHSNALIVQGVALALLMQLGLLMDKPAFQIPAAASMFLIFSVLTGLLGAFSYWLQSWRTLGLLIALIILNFFTRYDIFNYDTKAYGLNYTCEPATYNSESILEMSDTTRIQHDFDQTLITLEKWKEKNMPLTPESHQPDMILLNLSGGGLRSALWSMTVLQMLDSLLQSTLFDRTMLIAGASGGMLAGSYLHELHYLQKTKDSSISLHHPSFADNMAEDYLNALIFSIATNDLFYPFQSFTTAGHTYRKNRAYIFEKQLSYNTKGVINMDNRKISDYYEAEKNAVIPMLVLTPTIVTDRRKLFISSQPVTYLTRSYNKYGFNHDSYEADGIDCAQFFADQDGHNLLLSSAMRMSATFPYILPSTFLPSNPSVEVMDAGFRDNTGFETTFRFLNVFKDWINQNVGKVIVVFIRSDVKDRGVKPLTESLIAKVVKPATVFMTNEIQDNYADYMATITDETLYGKLQVINFEYEPSVKSQKAAMSLHLTTKEKHDIKNALFNQRNQRNLKEMINLLQTND